MTAVGKSKIAPLPTRDRSSDASAVRDANAAASTAPTTAPTTEAAASRTVSAHLGVVGEGAPSTTTHAPAARGGIDLRDPVAAHRAQLRADLKVALSTLKALPPALTFFGGARIQPTDPYYKISQELGRLLAERGVPPRTGAGPGIMQSVPEGYVQRRDQLAAQQGQQQGPSAQLRQIVGLGDGASLDDIRTQGFNIKLPHEQKLNPVIEVAKEIQLFPFRKLALYENARGVVTFPGGFGTLDELFEIWALSAAGALSDPLGAVGVEFWQPTMDVLKRIAVEDRKLIDPDHFARLFVSDDPAALLDHMLLPRPHTATKGFERDPEALEKTLLEEVDLATKGMKNLRPAVAFLGGESLAADDKALDVVKGIAAAVAREGVAVRVGDAGSGSRAVAAAVVDVGASKKNIQVIEWTASPTSSASSSASSPLPAPAASFQERIPHKELLLRAAEAYVVLPSGLKGLDEMATVLCQMQTGKLPKRPLVLVGSDYWRPLLDAWQQTMLSPERKLIAPEDMELFTVVDTVADARAALTNLR